MLRKGGGKFFPLSFPLMETTPLTVLNPGSGKGRIPTIHVGWPFVSLILRLIHITINKSKGKGFPR